MSNAAPQNAGLTDEEVAALAEMDAQIAGAADDDPLFNVDDVLKVKLTAEDAGLLTDKTAQEAADAEAKAALEKEAADKAAADAVAAAATPKNPEEEAAAAAAAQAAAEEQQPAPEQKLSQPLLVVQVPEGTNERLTAIAEEKKAIAAKFDDGDLTASEMNASLDGLNREERKLEKIIDRAEMAHEMENQRITNERTTEINTFLTSVNIPFDAKNLRYQALNQAVIQVASDPANVNLGVTDIMQKAHELCVEEGVLPPKKAGAEKLDPKTPVVPAPKPPKELNAPPTLGGLPASSVQTTEENRFAHLNRMGPDAREAAFAKMSPADQDAYLAAGA